jgi:excinuclease ABC subunit A
MSHSPDFIRIGGAREHNLKNISLEIPRNRLVVFTGVSGSGKSSLVFDTLFAEGQRKYVESLSAYARQFLNQLQKPDVDFIEGLSPAIAIEQRHSSGNPRSTIATITEVYDYLRLLFGHAGVPHCPETGEPVMAYTPSDIIRELLEMEEETRLILLAPIVQDEKGSFRDVLERLARDGFVRARVDGEIIDLTAAERPRLDPDRSHSIEVVVDRLVIRDKHRARLADSLETSLKLGHGSLVALTQPAGAADRSLWDVHTYSTLLTSRRTGIRFEKPTPRHFSFNSPLGACEDCQGLGYVFEFDPDLIIRDRTLSLPGGAVVPWKQAGRAMQGHYQRLAQAICQHLGIAETTRVSAFSAGHMDFLFYAGGGGAAPVELRAPDGSLMVFPGLIPMLDEQFDQSESEVTRRKLRSLMSPRRCPSCRGGRLRPELLAVTLPNPDCSIVPSNPAIPGFSIMDVTSMTIEEAWDFLGGVHVSGSIKAAAMDLVGELRTRLRFLMDVGLGYLGLDREFGTLSGGESQRIRLATQIGAGLVGVLYILDEPSIGLHQRDNDRLLATLEDLRDRGNSVVVVEHDEDTIRRADYLVDIGPGPGEKGGRVVAAGTVGEVLRHPESITAKYLRGEFTISVPLNRVPCRGVRPALKVLGARENNLKNIDVRIPLGAFVCVTGVSGSGKSTLVNDVICRGLLKYLYRSSGPVGAHSRMAGMEHINKVIVVDQTPIGKSPRSNPATFTGIFNDIRDLFAQIPAAKVRGYGPGRFSFNNRGGRCEKCQGDGSVKVEMHFLPPVYVECEFCRGRRYNRETLEITWKGLNIADVLDLTVDEAVTFFRANPNIAGTCETMSSVGLGYLRLGQSATTLSGGEAQRLKLASELRKKSVGSTFYILDEPTTGLHFHDVEKLLDVFFKLREAGGTVLVIEHNLDVIKMADWVLDLGPEGGEMGGRILVEGTPEDVAACPDSITGQYLKKYLK